LSAGLSSPGGRKERAEVEMGSIRVARRDNTRRGWRRATMLLELAFIV
jgi:hypothetical protein